MTDSPSASITPVVVTGFDMPFWPLVKFLIKLAIASIPASIVIGIVYVVAATVVALVMTALRIPFPH